MLLDLFFNLPYVRKSTTRLRESDIITNTTRPHVRMPLLSILSHSSA